MALFTKNNKKLFHYLLKNSKTLIDRDYNSKEIILYEGDKINSIGIVRSGLVEIVNYTYLGEKKSHEYLSTGTLIPIYQHLAGIREYKYTLRCEKEAKISWISTGEFEKIIKGNPEILYDMLIHIAKRGYKAQMQLKCMNYKKVRERLACWIIEMNHIDDKGYIEIPKTQTILADGLYVNRSSLNQELNKLVDEGFIEIEGHSLKIIDIEKLKENY